MKKVKIKKWLDKTLHMKIKAHVQKWYTMYPERQSIRGNQNRKVTYSACLLFGNDKITNYHRKGIFHMNRDSELPFKMNVFWGWGHSSVAQHVPGKCEVMSPIPNQTKPKQDKTVHFHVHSPHIFLDCGNCGRGSSPQFQVSPWEDVHKTDATVQGLKWRRNQGNSSVREKDRRPGTGLLPPESRELLENLVRAWEKMSLPNSPWFPAASVFC